MTVEMILKQYDVRAEQLTIKDVYGRIITDAVETLLTCEVKDLYTNFKTHNSEITIIGGF